MKSIYVIRHAARDFGSVHLNAEGVRAARLLGDRLGPMEYVATSPAQRCIETAVALGCAVQQEADELALPEDDDRMAELDRVRTFSDAVRLAAHGMHLPTYARELRLFVDRAANALLDNQDALLVTHGGIVELIAAAVDASAAVQFSDGVGYCDGVRICIAGSPSVEDALCRVIRIECAPDS